MLAREELLGNTIDQILFTILSTFLINYLDPRCSTDSDCDNKNCFYCLSSGMCSLYDSEYCDSHECGIGDGDCDSGTCASGTKCAVRLNNFLDYHPSLGHCSGTSEAEVCLSNGKKIKS